MFKKLVMIGGALAILAVGAATATDWTPVQEDMRFMREEEKLARDVYATLYDHHLSQGLTLTVCDNIAYSEQRHMEAMKQLLDNYSMADSAVDGGQGTYPESCLGDACKFNNTDLADLYVKLVADGKVSAFSFSPPASSPRWRQCRPRPWSWIAMAACCAPSPSPMAAGACQ